MESADGSRNAASDVSKAFQIMKTSDSSHETVAWNRAGKSGPRDSNTSEGDAELQAAIMASLGGDGAATDGMTVDAPRPYYGPLCPQISDENARPRCNTPEPSELSLETSGPTASAGATSTPIAPPAAKPASASKPAARVEKVLTIGRRPQ